MKEAPEIQVVSELQAAATMLSPLRLKILRALHEPGSATSLARELGEPRQKVNYHLRALEDAGLVELVEERKRRAVTERIVRSVARSYLISPEIIGSLGVTTAQVRDRFSSAYQVAILAENLRDIAFLRRKAEEAGRKLATLSLQTKIRFASAEDRNRFAAELSAFLAGKALHYHNDSAPEGREFTFNVTGYPSITKTDLQADQQTQQNETERRES